MKLEIALAIPASNDENRTPTPVYLDPGMHPGLEVKGLNRIFYYLIENWIILENSRSFYCIYTRIYVEEIRSVCYAKPKDSTRIKFLQITFKVSRYCFLVLKNRTNLNLVENDTKSHAVW